MNITVNPAKCEYSVDRISYVRYEISAEGVSVSKIKVKSIMEMRVPENGTELRSFLGLVNVVGIFVPDLQSVAEPLLRLTCRDEKFVWSKAQQVALDEVKETHI